MNHVVLVGDSIFDNAAYVPDHPPVIEQVRQGLPPGGQATLLAKDGHITEDVASQLTGMPADVTHIVVSVGGNNALMASRILGDLVVTVGEALTQLSIVLDRFRAAYIEMLKEVLALEKPTAVCTIYDAIPNIGPAERAALAGFNDIITRAAGVVGIPLLDLRLICNHPDDFSPLSPIEPSVIGGAKIADTICRMLAEHDFSSPRTAVWV